MTVEHRARPLELPLPGGQPKAVVKVHPLLGGEVLMPPTWYARPRGPLSFVRGVGLTTRRSKWFWAPVPAFLVEHPGAGPILVDTAFHPSAIDSPATNMGRLGATVNSIRMTPEQAIAEQVRARGVQPRELSHVVMTHLHWDHASAISEFPGATFVVDAVEWDAARSGGLLQGYHQPMLHPLYDWRTVDFTSDAVDSYDAFGRAIDLFGDESVMLVHTPGHTKGHMSLLLRCEGRQVLLAADAAYAQRTIDETLVPAVVADEHLYVRSLKEIQRFLGANPDTIVIPGHDPQTWATLAEVY